MQHGLACRYFHLVAFGENSVELVVLKHEVVTALVVFLLYYRLQCVLLSVVFVVLLSDRRTAGNASAVCHEVIVRSSIAQQQHSVVSLHHAFAIDCQEVLRYYLRSHLSSVLCLHGIYVDACRYYHVTSCAQRPVFVFRLYCCHHLRSLVVALQRGHQRVVVYKRQCGMYCSR